MSSYHLGMLFGMLFLLPIGAVYWWLGKKIDQYNDSRKAVAAIESLLSIIDDPTTPVEMRMRIRLAIMELVYPKKKVE